MDAITPTPTHMLAYLPPHLRGESYEGPTEAPINGNSNVASASPRPLAPDGRPVHDRQLCDRRSEASCCAGCWEYYFSLGRKKSEKPNGIPQPTEEPPPYMIPTGEPPAAISPVGVSDAALDAAPMPDDVPIAEPDGELPTIIAGGNLADATGRAWDALAAANVPPVLFRYGSMPARIETDDEGQPIVRAANHDRIRHRLARVAKWQTIILKGDKQYVKSIHPPKDIVADVLATPDPPLPVLTRIVECPVFAADGTLQTTRGYHPLSRTYLASDCDFPDVPTTPTADYVREAVRLLRDELMGDFPFVDDSDKAHALAWTLLPFVREMIDGPTPIHNVEAPGPGTGKTLLVDATTIPAAGRSATAMTEGKDEDEWRKRLFAKLNTAPSVVFVDNVRRRVDCSALASAVTAWPLWEDRLLGKSEIIRVPVRCVWMLTGNNPAFSSEMARRTVRCRLDAQQDQPWLRGGFRHANLTKWAKENRGQLVWACLTLIQTWIATGRKPGKYTLGMFEQWAETMGGILDIAGVPGFLGNLQNFYADADAEGGAWRAFVGEWWTRHGDAKITVSELFGLAADAGFSLEGKSDQAQKIQLGKKIGSARDRVFKVNLQDKAISLRIERTGQHNRATTWALARTE